MYGAAASLVVACATGAPPATAAHPSATAPRSLSFIVPPFVPLAAIDGDQTPITPLCRGASALSRPLIKSVQMVWLTVHTHWRDHEWLSWSGRAPRGLRHAPRGPRGGARRSTGCAGRAPRR